MENKTLQQMLEELEQFYEAAGFEDYYETVLKKMSEQEMIACYEKTAKESPEIFGCESKK